MFIAICTQGDCFQTMATLCLLFVISFITRVSSSRNSSSLPELDPSVFPRTSSKTGDLTCRCLTATELAPFEWDDLAPAGRATLEGYVNNSEYGYGCAPHDSNTPACTEECNGCYQKWCNRRYVRHRCLLISCLCLSTSTKLTGSSYCRTCATVGVTSVSIFLTVIR